MRDMLQLATRTIQAAAMPGSFAPALIDYGLISDESGFLSRLERMELRSLRAGPCVSRGAAGSWNASL
jgi:hypothetical protein